MRDGDRVRSPSSSVTKWKNGYTAYRNVLVLMASMLKNNYWKFLNKDFCYYNFLIFFDPLQ